MSVNWYELVLDYYTKGYYTPSQVKRFAEVGKLTFEQAEEIIATKS